jgi:Zn-finger nucleic acid-binding protein
MKLKADMQSFKCEYCQSVYFPDKNDDGVRVLDEPSGQQCPVCNTPLVHAVLAKSQIIYCTGCKGTLVPMGMLESIVEELRSEHGTVDAPTAGDKDDLHRKINCPQCHHPMDAHFYAGPGNVVVDSCEECCLIWLDRGALTRIAHAPDSPPASAPEDLDSQPADDWTGLGERSIGDTIVDGIVESFFK